MAIHTQRVLRGVTTKLDSPFTRPAQVFLGWSTNKQSQEVEYVDKGEYAFDDDITLYAVWGETQQVTLTFDTNEPGTRVKYTSGQVWIFNIVGELGADDIDIPDHPSVSDAVEIWVGNTVTSIAANGFKNLTALKDVELPDSVQSIGASAFSGCSGLEKINIPYGLESINQGTFRNCSNLTNVELPETVETIGEEAFGGCTGLTSITMPSGLARIDPNAFSGCTNLASVTFSGDVPTVEDGQTEEDDPFWNVASGARAYVDGTMDGWSQIPNGSLWKGLIVTYNGSAPDGPDEQATFLTAENGNLITTENVESEDNIIVE